MRRRTRAPANATAAALLGLLVDAGELTGADLARLAQVRIGGYWNITRSQVYRELGGLADAGLVQPGAPGPRAAQPYRVTAAGETAFRRWLEHAEPKESIRIGVLLLLTFGRFAPPERLASVLAAAAARHRRQLAEYEALDEALAQAEADPWIRATLSFGLHYERAVLAWLAELPAAVRRPQVPPDEA